ncbi:hypothetical protein [Saccharothrix longispora]|nr:hypothetical protein [Saccharothrix longispora]MDU0293555.1 hypothetical protein [Saccharothrix longispora]
MAELDPPLPAPTCLVGRGRWEKHCRQVIVDAILYVVDDDVEWQVIADIR